MNRNTKYILSALFIDFLFILTLFLFPTKGPFLSKVFISIALSAFTIIIIVCKEPYTPTVKSIIRIAYFIGCIGLLLALFAPNF